jgi:NADPH:quinone reductase-like Zn-dependent oxidoreductase
VSLIPPATRPVLEELGRLVESGDLKPQIGHVFPLENAGDAHALSETGHGRGRILLKVSD